MSIAPRLPCLPFPVFAWDWRIELHNHPQYVAPKPRIDKFRDMLYALPQEFDCMENPHNSEPEDFTLMVKIMQTDANPVLRARAAAVLDAFTGDQRAAITALTDKLSSEQVVEAATARVAMIGRLMHSAPDFAWKSNIPKEKFSSFLLAVLIEVNSSGSGGSGDSVDETKMEAYLAARGATLVAIAAFLERTSKTRAIRGHPSSASLVAEAENAILEADLDGSIWDELIRGMAQTAIQGRGPWRPRLLSHLERAFADDKLIRTKAPLDVLQTLFESLAVPSAEIRSRIARTIETGANSLRAADGSPRLDLASKATSQQINCLTGTASNALNDPNAAVRAASVNTLGLFATRSDKLAGLMIKKLVDNDVQVRANAARVLTNWNPLPAEAIAPLQHIAETGAQDAEYAMAALSSNRSPEVIASLIRALKRQNVFVPREPWPEKSLAIGELAVHALTKIGKPAVLPLLGNIATANSPELRDRLLTALAHIGWTTIGSAYSEEVAAALDQAIQGDDPEIRDFGLYLLAQWRRFADRPFPD